MRRGRFLGEVSVPGKQRNQKTAMSFKPWLIGWVTAIGSAVSLIAVFFNVTPLDVDTPAKFVAVVLIGIFVGLAGLLIWGRRHGGHGWRWTAFLAVGAVLVLTGGLLLFFGTGDASLPGPSAGSESPTTPEHSPTPPDAGRPAGAADTTTADQIPAASAGTPKFDPAKGIPVSPAPSTFSPTRGPADAALPPAPPRTTSATGGSTIVAGQTVQYSGEFRLNASQESVDLDPIPPQPYGDVNELAVGDHEIWVVPPDSQAVAVDGPATRAQCADAINRANPPSAYFENPQPDQFFCVHTSGDRYALIQVLRAAVRDFTLQVTVWNK